jgi:hypothetical protein
MMPFDPMLLVQRRKRAAPSEEAIMTSKRDGDRGLTVRVPFEGDAAGSIDAAAYLFDAGGALLAAAPVAEGRARFPVEQVPPGTRLFIGPALEGRREGRPSLATMERLRAFETEFRFEPGQRIYELSPIPSFIWPFWSFCPCRVRGRVFKRSHSADGVVRDIPVCKARVHICEVDPLLLIIARLPDSDVFRLGDEIIRYVEWPLPGPHKPDPPTEFGPFEQVVSPEAKQAALVRRAATVQVFGRDEDLASLNPQPLPPLRLAAGGVGEAVDRRLPIAARAALGSRSAEVVRRALADRLDLIRALLCQWPWAHSWFATYEELRVVITDEDGRFDTNIWYPCEGDKPDLYFWVEYSVGGVWTTVYRPPVPCHVWWDYQCGSEVRITLTDPRVRGCRRIPPPPQGKKVVIRSIGTEVSMGEIVRASVDAAKAGMMVPGWFHPTRESPFGRRLDPCVDFGDGLKSAGITHYRWSYRRLENGAAWISIVTEVSRHYVVAGAPGAPSVYKLHSSGPVLGDLFEIDPDLPAGAEKWDFREEMVDLPSAHWNTEECLDGKYELKLELFRNAGGKMTPVDLTAEGVELHEIDVTTSLADPEVASALAPDDRQLRATGGVNVAGYRFEVHIDNRICRGTIDPVEVIPGVNDTKCGFREYGPDAFATFRFAASHPDNQAWFDFQVARVGTLLPSASVNDLVDGSGSNGFVRTGEYFSKTVPIATLLGEALADGETPCVRAVFAATLQVYALATDGYVRLNHLDAPRATDPEQVAVRAFAIVPTSS